jgi:predicted amidohydrolase YtcJ
MKIIHLALIIILLPDLVLSQEVNQVRIYEAREIVTLDKNYPMATAVAIKKDRIIGVGEVEQLINKFPNAQLDTRFSEDVMVPGLIEHHVHPFLAAITMESNVIAIDDWDLPGNQSKGVRDREAYLNRLKAEERLLSEPDKPLVTWGFHHYFHGTLSRQDLDKISMTRPILVIHRSFHEFILNSSALDFFGITQELVNNFDEEAKEYASFKKGHFSEQGMVSILPYLMKYLAAPDRLIKGLQTTEKYLHNNGVTLVANPGAYSLKPVQDAKNFVFGDEETPFRSFYIPSGLLLAEQYPADELVEKSKEFLSWGKGKVEYLPLQIKLFTDGAMYSQNMVMRDGYLDGHQGAWLMQEKIYREAFQRFWDAGYQIHIHQNGDAGLDRLLDVLEDNLQRNPRVDHRTVIVHFGYSNFDQVERINNLGAIVSANPYYVNALSDLYSRLGVGATRSRDMVRLGDVHRAGIPISLHSDMPMAPAAPLLLMHAAVNRVNFANKVAGPNQRISPEVALRAVTYNAAYVLGMEHDYGTISSGKYANFTLLSDNPLTIDPLKIKEIKIRATMVEGQHYPIH